MGAPARLSGGRASNETKPKLTATSATKPAADRSPRERSASGTKNKGEGVLPKPPQGHSGYKRSLGPYRPPRRDGTAPRYTNKSVKRQMLDAALEVASERGYEAMRISEVTDPIGVTRQAFYVHFRNKRQCLCEAIDPKLGAIERMAVALAEGDPDAGIKLAHALDDLIAERFGSPEGTRGRLVDAMITLLREHGSFHKVRIGALTKTAHVPPGDFYRQFSGKRECFAVAYEQLLGELVAEVDARATEGAIANPEECPAEHTRSEVPALLASLTEALLVDDDRRRILIVELAHLPDQAPADMQGAQKSALADAIGGLLGDCEGVNPQGPKLTFAASSIVEVIRSTEVAGQGTQLKRRLSDLAQNLSLMLAADTRRKAPAAPKEDPGAHLRGLPVALARAQASERPKAVIRAV